MSLDPLVAGLVLLAALLHASWNAVVKADADRLVPFTMIMLTGAVIGLIGVILLPLPAPAAWKWLILSAAIHYLYYFFLLRSYRFGDLSHVYPIARGLGPALVALFSGLLISEILTWREFLGVGLVSLGIVALAAGSGSGGFTRRASRLAVLTGFTIAGYTFVDGLGGRASEHTLSYIAWLNVIEAPGVVLVAWLRRRHTLWGQLRRQWLQGTIAGIIATVSYAIAIWALSVSPMAPVAALRETSVLFAAVIGRLILDEPFGQRRMAAAAIIVAGLIEMHFAIL